MHNFIRHSVELSNWQAASARRLKLGMLLATLLVVAILSILRLPVVDRPNIPQGLEVDLVPLDEPAPRVSLDEETVTDAPQERTAEDIESPDEAAPDKEAEISSASHAPDSGTDETVTPAVDWEAEKTVAVQNAVDEMEKTFSANPGFDEQRAEAAIQFRPSGAPVKREIWENVEQDELGRTLLRSGNCYRVLDDPSVANQWAFENFDQYITYCTYRKYVGKDLEWVEEIKQRFRYLREREDRRKGIFEDN